MKMISDETMVPDFSHRLSPYTGHNPKPMDPARLLKALGGSDENAKYLGAFPNKNGELWDVWYVEEKKLLVFDARTENRSFSKLAQDMARLLLEQGIYVIGFSYPVVPKGQARIRVQISAGHSQQDLEKAVAAFTAVGKTLGVI